MVFSDFSKCRHGETTHCKNCLKNGTLKCTLKRVLLDASVILRLFLEQEDANIALYFLRQNRQRHRVVVTLDIFGEIFNTLIHEPDEKRIESALLKYTEYLCGFEIINLPFKNSAFVDLLSKLISSQELRCEHTDRINVAVAINEKLAFYFKDQNLKKDIDTINKIAEKTGAGKLKLFKPSFFINKP